jgi:DNA-binding MarR family transcriptional regulator
MAPSPELIEEILEQLSVMTVDVEELTGATANFVRLNRTDFHALQVLSSSRGMTAGELARALRVTTGATTRVIDSLVAAGHARREWDPEDRRRILVSVTPAALRALERSRQRLRDDAKQALEGFRPEELETILRFLTGTRGLLRDQARRLARGVS